MTRDDRPGRPPAVDETSTDAGTRAPEEAARAVGSYRLLEELGRGATGVVYLAAPADVGAGRRVALKLITSGDAGAILRRFRHERRVLAGLDHPNIAALLDAGTMSDGIPYFVMEHVDGQPIDAWCDTRAIGPDGRLRLFRTVCAAVHYAHQRRVVHRDLKPGNVFVTTGGVPKLLDFGTAHVLDTGPGDTHDARGGSAMTLGYASPEQLLGGDITPASDVYALGVLLYLLLTGRLPHDVAGCRSAEVARAVTSAPVVRPSRAITSRACQTRGGSLEQLRHALAGPLDAIVTRALHVDPAARYESAQALADDVDRALAGRPVSARGGPLLRRLAKAAHRAVYRR